VAGDYKLVFVKKKKLWGIICHECPCKMFQSLQWMQRYLTYWLKTKSSKRYGKPPFYIKILHSYTATVSVGKRKKKKAWSRGRTWMLGPWRTSTLSFCSNSVLSPPFEMEAAQLPCGVVRLRNIFQGHVTSGFKGQSSDSSDSPSPPWCWGQSSHWVEAL